MIPLKPSTLFLDKTSPIDSSALFQNKKKYDSELCMSHNSLSDLQVTINAKIFCNFMTLYFIPLFIFRLDLCGKCRIHRNKWG